MSTTPQLTGTPSHKWNTSGIDNAIPHISPLVTNPNEDLKWIAERLDLSLTEIFDLYKSLSEFKQGKGKYFKNSKTALKWLDSDEDEDV